MAEQCNRAIHRYCLFFGGFYSGSIPAFRFCDATGALEIDQFVEVYKCNIGIAQQVVLKMVDSLLKGLLAFSAAHIRDPCL